MCQYLSVKTCPPRPLSPSTPLTCSAACSPCALTRPPLCPTKRRAPIACHLQHTLVPSAPLTCSAACSFWPSRDPDLAYSKGRHLSSAIFQTLSHPLPTSPAALHAPLGPVTTPTLPAQEQAPTFCNLQQPNAPSTHSLPLHPSHLQRCVPPWALSRPQPCPPTRQAHRPDPMWGRASSEAC